MGRIKNAALRSPRGIRGKKVKTTVLLNSTLKVTVSYLLVNTYRRNNISRYHYVLGYKRVPFVNNRSLVPGAYKTRKIQNTEKYNLSMYKVLTSWASIVRSSLGFHVGGKLNPMFLTKTALCKSLKPTIAINQSLGTNVTSVNYIMQTLEASYKSNFLKVFSGFVKSKTAANKTNEFILSLVHQRWYNKPGHIDFLSMMSSFSIFPFWKNNKMVR